MRKTIWDVNLNFHFTRAEGLERYVSDGAAQHISTKSFNLGPITVQI